MQHPWGPKRHQAGGKKEQGPGHRGSQLKMAGHTPLLLLNILVKGSFLKKAEKKQWHHVTWEGDK